MVPIGLRLDSSKLLHSPERTGSKCVLHHGSGCVERFKERKELGITRAMAKEKYGEIAPICHLVILRAIPLSHYEATGPQAYDM
jgi:hypothetical protein